MSCYLIVKNVLFLKPKHLVLRTYNYNILFWYDLLLASAELPANYDSPGSFLQSPTLSVLIFARY